MRMRRVNGTAQTRQREQQTSAVGTVTPSTNGIATPGGQSLRATANNPSGAVTGVARTNQGDKRRQRSADSDSELQKRVDEKLQNNNLWLSQDEFRVALGYKRATFYRNKKTILKDIQPNKAFYNVGPAKKYLAKHLTSNF